VIGSSVVDLENERQRKSRTSAAKQVDESLVPNKNGKT